MIVRKNKPLITHTEQLELKAVSQMISHALCQLDENRKTIDFHVLTCHDIKKCRDEIKFKMRAVV
jgi:hypothetical protein